jgi:neutral ceramidase
MTGHVQCTAAQIAAGLPLLGGAADGRTAGYYEGCVEGLRNHEPGRSRTDPQYPKVTKPEGGCQISFVIPIPSTTVVSTLFPAPENIPFGVYQLGPLALVAVPGEFTTVLGTRIRDAVNANIAPTPIGILIVGLANEYLSYFATPEEYEAQHYEGASTLYGKWSGAVAIDELTLLAKELKQGAPRPTSTRNYSYFPGFTFHFGALARAEDFRGSLLNDLSNILLDQTTGLPLGTKAPHFCWKEPAANYQLPIGIPVVAVQTRETDGRWHSLVIDGIPEDDHGTNIVFGIEHVEERVATACVFWMPPSQNLRGTFRFHVMTADGSPVDSLPIALPDSVLPATPE